MSGKRYFFKDKKVGFGIYSSVDDRADEDEEDDSELLQDIPYSSSSLDRSSIGSIPWADDAIKQNQLDWERVERLLSGVKEDKLPDELELCKEILEWQRKFPQLVSVEAVSEKRQSFDSTPNLGDLLDIDLISNLSLNSLNDADDGLATPTNEDQQHFSKGTLHHGDLFSKKSTHRHFLTHKPKEDGKRHLDLMNEQHNLRISSVPMTLRKRSATQSRNVQNFFQKQIPTDPKLNTFSSTSLPQTPPTRRQLHSSKISSLLIMQSTPSSISNGTNATTTPVRMRMPPIVNVLESKRRFRGLPNNRSFVQLSNVPQAKSAAVTTRDQHASRERRQSAWQVPLAATTINRQFFNNRNSIVLPAISLERVRENTTIESDSAGKLQYGKLHGISTSMGSYDGSGRRHFAMMTPQRVHNVASTATTTPSTGRSISAVLHPHLRYQEFNTFYLPYSASKFKVFK